MTVNCENSTAEPNDETGVAASSCDAQDVTVAARAARIGRHERVLDEGARQLNEKGVLLTSLAEIASKLGVTRGAMYHYVEDRQDLVFQCYRRAAEIIARHLHEAERVGGTPAQVLADFIDRMLDPNEPEIAARAEIAMMNQAQRDTIQGLYDALAARIAHVLDTGQREGVLRACDVDVNARAILSLVTWAPLARPWARIAGAMDSERLRHAVMATVFEGFSTRPQLPDYEPLDLSKLAPRVVSAFDRDAASEAKRDALLRVASRTFNRKGIDATSLEEVAAQLGTTKRTFHHLIGSKQQVVSACYERAFRIFLFIKDRMLEYPGTRLEALASAMDAMARAYPNEDLCPLSPLVGHAALSPEGQETFMARSKQLGEAYHGLMRQGVAEGSIGEVDLQARTLMLAGLLGWLVKDDVPTEPSRQQHIAREIANLVAVGLQIRA